MTKSVAFTEPVEGLEQVKFSTINPNWILSGSPQQRHKQISKSDDGTSWTVVWECSAGSFDWHYYTDETAIILSGEVIIIDKYGKSYKLRGGDVAFFSSGEKFSWHVTDNVKKIAILRKHIPEPFAFFVRIWHRVLRICGVRGKSTLMAVLISSLAVSA